MFLFLFLFCSCGDPPLKKKIIEENVSAVEENVFILEKDSKTEKPTRKELIQEELRNAHSKTDCMIDYLNKKDSGDIQKSFEEYCR